MWRVWPGVRINAAVYEQRQRRGKFGDPLSRVSLALLLAVATET